MGSLERHAQHDDLHPKGGQVGVICHAAYVACVSSWKQLPAFFSPCLTCQAHPQGHFHCPRYFRPLLL